MSHLDFFPSESGLRDPAVDVKRRPRPPMPAAAQPVPMAVTTQNLQAEVERLRGQVAELASRCQRLEDAQRPGLPWEDLELLNSRDGRRILAGVLAVLVIGFLVSHLPARNPGEVEAAAAARRATAAGTPAPGATEQKPVADEPQPVASASTTGTNALEPVDDFREPAASNSTTHASAPAVATSGTAAPAAASAPAQAPPSMVPLVIVSNPRDAVVRIDRRPYGRTPLTSVPVAAGSHVVSVERPGYRPWTRRIVVSADTPMMIEATLQSRRPVRATRRR